MPAIAIVLLLSSGTGWGAAEQTENPPPLRADQFLTAEELSGPSWRVEPEVTTDGLTNTYSVTSPYGTWPARGRARVLVRITETAALAQLEEVSKSDVFLDAVKNSVTAPIDLISAVATQPVETVKAVPKSIGRWFRNTSFKVSESFNSANADAEDEDASGDEPDPEQDESNEAAKKYAAQFLKISSAERNWYAKLGVDPYTDNELLRTSVESVAKVEGLTNFAMKLAPLPRIPAQSEIQMTMNLVWKTDPWELRRRNRKIMLEGGLTEETARAFENNPALTPTIQTALIEALVALDGVGGRASIIARGIEAETREQGELLVWSTFALRMLHEKDAPLATFLAETFLPVARTQANELVTFVPAEAVFWTEAVATAASEFANEYSAEPAGRRTVRLPGKVSDSARGGLENLGWEVVEDWRPDT